MKYFIFCCFFLSSGLFLYAQEPNCSPAAGCVNGISTNPDNPANPQCPANINSFDWRTQRFDYYLRNVSGISVRSPFYNSNSLPSTEHIWNNSLYNAPDHEWYDGWELIKYDLGTETDEVVLAYIVLYNKFSATLRVLGVSNEDEEIRYVKVTVSLNQSVNAARSAVLNPQGGISQPLTERTSVQRVTALQEMLNDPTKFFAVDFQMGYDACVCEYNSQLNIRFEFVQEAQIDMYGRTFGFSNTVANISQGNGSVADRDFLHAVYEQEQFGTKYPSTQRHLAPLPDLPVGLRHENYKKNTF